MLLTTQYLEEADGLADQIVVLDRGRVIATGTVEQLKAQVGGDRLELVAPSSTDPQLVAAAMVGLGTGEPRVDVEAGSVVIPVADGPGVLPEVAARLSDARLRTSDLALRRPTLDDVFLTLTGQEQSSAATGTGPSSRQENTMTGNAVSTANTSTGGLGCWPTPPQSPAATCGG